MRAYVINLPASAHRRQRMEAQLQRSGLPFEFVEGIDGMRLTASERARLLDEARVAKSPGWFTPGLIGCALSHWSVYRRIAQEEEEVALVLEDDAVLPTDIAELTDRHVAQHMNSREVVLLYFRSRRPCHLSEQGAVVVEEHRLLYPMQVQHLLASTAYMVTRNAARALAEAIVPLRAGPDSWGYYYELGVLDSVRCVVPHPVGVDASLESTLGYGDQVALRRLLKRQRIWPISQLRALNRRRIARKMTRVRLVREASPIALNIPLRDEMR